MPATEQPEQEVSFCTFPDVNSLNRISTRNFEWVEVSIDVVTAVKCLINRLLSCFMLAYEYE